jgi:hypothetical protein
MSFLISLAGVGLALAAMYVRSERVALGLALASAVCIGSALTLEVVR